MSTAPLNSAHGGPYPPQQHRDATADGLSAATDGPPGDTTEDYGGRWSWSREPARWSRADGSPGSLTVVAPGRSDLFAMPGHYDVDRLPLLQRPVDGDFAAWSRITVDGGAFGDAGGIALHGEDGWLKVCVERTRTGGWAMVTVLSRPESDEAMGPALDGPAADVMVTREGRRVAVLFRQYRHEDWRFVRTYLARTTRQMRLGIFVQAPFSEAASAQFEPMRLSPTAWRDQR
ncbi:DUF1349 domain-containing protein [Sorangium sp. So ce385]|uniref:DUF1349 domain-containing protein n=1 Tax=Sorangium sp. So ce385 TaxID=3133308 RepID=UPI003F5B9394